MALRQLYALCWTKSLSRKENKVMTTSIVYFSTRGECWSESLMAAIQCVAGSVGIPDNQFSCVSGDPQPFASFVEDYCFVRVTFLSCSHKHLTFFFVFLPFLLARSPVPRVTQSAPLLISILKPYYYPFHSNSIHSRWPFQTTHDENLRIPKSTRALTRNRGETKLFLKTILSDSKYTYIYIERTCMSALLRRDGYIRSAILSL